MMGAHALREGFDPGLVVHMGKILECGAAAAYPRHGSDGLLGTVERDAFTLTFASEYDLSMKARFGIVAPYAPKLICEFQPGALQPMFP